MANPLDSEPELLPFASSEERQLLGARVLSGDDEQAMLAELRAARERWLATLNPTREQTLATTHKSNRDHVALGNATSDQFWEGLKREWKAYQKPTAEDVSKARNPTLSPQNPPIDPVVLRDENGPHGWGDPNASQAVPETLAPALVDPPPETLAPELPEWVNSPEAIHLSLEDEAVAEASDAPPEDEDDGPPFDSRARQHPITPELRKKIEGQGKWGSDWPSTEKSPDPESKSSQIDARAAEDGGGSLSRWLTVKPQMGFVAKIREASKVGTVYISDWVVLGLFVAAALGFGGVALSEHLYTLAEILFFFGIGLFVAKAVYDHRTHELKRHLEMFFVVIGVVVFLFLVIWVEWARHHEAVSAKAPKPTIQLERSQGQNQGNEKTLVDPVYLVGLYKKYNSAQADEAVKPYLGKSAQVSGTVSDVYRQKLDGREAASVIIKVSQPDGSVLYVAWADFTDERWVSRALIYAPGESVTVVGALNGVDKSGITLGPCEIIEH